MPNIDKDWVLKQLAESKVDPRVGTAVVVLLKAWGETVDLEHQKLQQKAVEVFSKLALGKSLIDQKQENENWVEARPGFIKVGDEVMVKPDAFQSDAKHIHNGRRGRVVAVRYGDIIVNTTDGLEPEIKGAHYSPNHLLKLVQ